MGVRIEVDWVVINSCWEPIADLEAPFQVQCSPIVNHGDTMVRKYAVRGIPGALFTGKLPFQEPGTQVSKFPQFVFQLIFCVRGPGFYDSPQIRPFHALLLLRRFGMCDERNSIDGEEDEEET